MKQQNQAPIHAGETLEPKGNWFISRSITGKVFAVLNAVLKMKVKLANSKFAKVFISGEGGLVVDLTQVEATGTGGSGSFRGEWVQDTYMAFETVVITGGLYAGYYISLYDNNTQQPYNSVLWKQLANNVNGNWL